MSTLSQFLGNNGPQGTTPKGWVIFNATTGALIAQSGAFVSTTRSSAGNYSFVLNSGVVSDYTRALLIVRPITTGGAGLLTGQGAMSSNTAGTVRTDIAGTLSDGERVHVEVWA